MEGNAKVQLSTLSNYKYIVKLNKFQLQKVRMFLKSL
jgi:hypothetical protein